MQLQVVDLQSDGQDSYTVYFPSIHPMVTMAASISTNFYTESLQYSQTVNELSSESRQASNVSA